MKKIGYTLLVCFLALALLVFKLASSMDDGHWEPLAGLEGYYVRTDYEGMTLLGYSNFRISSPDILLGQVDGFKKVGAHLIISKKEYGQYFLLNAAPQYAANAESSMIGPLAKGQLNQKLVQFYGDSTFHLTLIN